MFMGKLTYLAKINDFFSLGISACFFFPYLLWALFLKSKVFAQLQKHLIFPSSSFLIHSSEKFFPSLGKNCRFFHLYKKIPTYV